MFEKAYDFYISGAAKSFGNPKTCTRATRMTSRALRDLTTLSGIFSGELEPGGSYGMLAFCYSFERKGSRRHLECFRFAIVTSERGLEAIRDAFILQ